MATSYPGGLDAFTNPTATDSLGSTTVPHATQHANANDAIEAIQAELGTDPSGASATVKARFEVIEANDWVTSARIAANAVGASELADNAVDTAAIADLAVTTGKLADSAVTSGKIADGTIVDADINASAAIAQSKIANLTSDLAGKAPSTCLYLSGAAGNYVSAPDTAALSITGDIDIRVKVALNDWTPATTNVLIAKWQTVTTKSYAMFIDGSGNVGMYYSTDGSATLVHTVTAAATGFADGAVGWVRVTRASSTGVITAYKSTDGSSWTSLGTVTGTSGNLHDNNSVVEIGGIYLGQSFIAAGRFHRVQILSGIGGTVVGDWRGDVAATRFRDAYSNVWTVNGTANGYEVA